MSLRNNYLERMGELLAFHKIIGNPKDLTDKNMDEMILAFQEKVNIMLDGNPRWDTLWQLQYPWVLGAPKLPFVKCPADRAPGSQGYDHLWLRQDAAERLNALRKEITDLGGLLTTSGGKRELAEGPSASRSATSMHYPGLAFDLAIDSGFFKPDTDPFVVTLGGNQFWEVWCRVQKGTDMKMNVVYWDGWQAGVDRTKTIMGKFVSFTKLAAKHGFYPIRPRLSFTRSHDRKYEGCEWWHFQANDLLIPYLSQFGIELLRIEGYTPESIQAANADLWLHRQYIFQIEWF